MLPSTDEDKTAVLNYLRELDCCSRCIMRYLGVKRSEGMTNISDSSFQPEYYLDTKLVDFEQPAKRIKKSPCRACLNILEESTLEKYVTCISLTEVERYDHKDFQQFISLPKSIHMRDRSMFIHLKEKFPHIYKEHSVSDLEMLKWFFRVASCELISKKLSKPFKGTSNFIILFNISYEDDEKEMKGIAKLRSYKDISRGFIDSFLRTCTDESFKAIYPVPPSVPVKDTEASIELKSSTVYIGGRYLKFSRDMGQTPWIINNKVMAEFCLQDILFDSIEKIIGCDKKNLTFSASGREDNDTRMLGNGRPFYVQIENPLFEHISFEKFRAIEADVFASKLVAIMKLQEVEYNSLVHIKDGEQFKKKHYCALCKTDAVDLNQAVQLINATGRNSLEIAQVTPLRVLHRRTQAVRMKTIYSMEASVVAGHLDLILVHMVTQAGTYVKEFVHGDFQRTKPNLSSIIGYPIDVVALDVTEIELQWP